jgi:hypothetical protein
LIRHPAILLGVLPARHAATKVIRDKFIREEPTPRAEQALLDDKNNPKFISPKNPFVSRKIEPNVRKKKLHEAKMEMKRT